MENIYLYWSNKNIVQFGCIHNLVVTLLIACIASSVACPPSNSVYSRHLSVQTSTTKTTH